MATRITDQKISMSLSDRYALMGKLDFILGSCWLSRVVSHAEAKEHRDPDPPCGFIEYRFGLVRVCIYNPDRSVDISWPGGDSNHKGWFGEGWSTSQAVAIGRAVKAAGIEMMERDGLDPNDYDHPEKA